MQPRTRSAWRWIVGFMLAVVLYVLSIGPAYGVFMCDPNMFVRWGFVYQPIRAIADQSDPTRQALLWYINLWIVRPSA